MDEADKTKNNSTGLIPSIVFFCAFLMMLLINLFLCRFIHFISLAIYLIPSIFFFVVFKRKRENPDKTIKKVWIVVITVFSSIVLFIVLLVVFCTESMLPVKSAVYYQHLYRMYNNPPRISMAHFPKSVPGSAKNVRFYESPAFLQGGSDFILAYTTDIDSVNDIYNTYSSGAQVIIKSDTFPPGSEESMALPHFSYDNVGYFELPQDFDIIILDSKPAHPGDWNHGYTYGIAVSRQRLEVIYWRQEW